MTQQHRSDDIERAVRRLPERDPADSLWPRIEEALREEQRAVTQQAASGFLPRLAQSFRMPALNLMLYAAVILVGAAMSWYLLSDYARQHDQPAAMQDRNERLLDAQSDFEQAIFYYERAIGKLSVLAEESETELDPQFVALQKEKITLLRESITECKAALKKNGAHPEVQHYLLAAYTDLQQTLQAMVSRAQ
ncbi:MAG: hypothetical protein RRA94_08920 [Bacteroidota bacterium]|nr:hypothetical protein [Bacteroidota bacterium]